MATEVEQRHDNAGSGLGEARDRIAAPGPPKARRRWGLFAAMVLVVCLGALGNVWLHAATTSATQVVAARSTIQRGALITAEDLMSVRVEVDPTVHTVPAADLGSMVGKRAALDVAAGSLLTPESVVEVNVPADGYSLVGVGVAQAMMPGTQLLAGDEIRLVAATADPAVAAAATSADPVSIAAVVVSTRAGTDPTVAGSQTIITVQVPTTDAARLAALASTGKVAVVLDSRDR
ncbi:MAG: hypothetical protein KQH57_11845 [Actinomycetales bacterium]|nr:hypothetical protein [Actinomycetales bacterium]